MQSTTATQEDIVKAFRETSSSINHNPFYPLHAQSLVKAYHDPFTTESSRQAAVLAMMQSYAKEMESMEFPKVYASSPKVSDPDDDSKAAIKLKHGFKANESDEAVINELKSQFFTDDNGGGLTEKGQASFFLKSTETVAQELYRDHPGTKYVSLPDEQRLSKVLPGSVIPAATALWDNASIVNRVRGQNEDSDITLLHQKLRAREYSDFRSSWNGSNQPGSQASMSEAASAD